MIKLNHCSTYRRYLLVIFDSFPICFQGFPIGQNFVVHLCRLLLNVHIDLELCLDVTLIKTDYLIFPCCAHDFKKQPRSVCALLHEIEKTHPLIVFRCLRRSSAWLSTLSYPSSLLCFSSSRELRNLSTIPYSSYSLSKSISMRL